MIFRSKKHGWMAGTALAAALLANNAALAQSTGSTTEEGSSSVSEVVVKVHQQSNADGLAVPVTAAKDQSVVTQDYIQHQVGSSNFAQLINELPGVSYSTEDPTGILSSDFRMHGYDGAHVSFTFDGAPLNDTGNYAIYPGEYLPDEVLDHISVNMGQTEVDSPTASAIGGTVNLSTKLPDETAGFKGSVAGGSYDFRRLYAEANSGVIGNNGPRAFLSINLADADKYKGDGNIAKYGADGRIYQPLNGSDFISLAGTYAQDRTYFYESDSLANFARLGDQDDYNTAWGAPTVTPGVADSTGPTAAEKAAATPLAYAQSTDSNFWRLHPNPVNFGILRGNSKFTLTKQLTLTVDPYFFYTLANGGGTTSLSEKDARLSGSAGGPACHDLNGDGDCLDSVLVYSPSDTQTHRYGLNTSLLYDLDDHNRFQFAYSLDYGRHSQTGFFTGIDQQTGVPDNLFGGLHGYGPDVLDASGNPLTTRHRFSIAKLNQFALNWVGKFDSDRLRLNVGVRDPHFERDLNQLCYSYNGSSVQCSSVPLSAVQAALAADNAANAAAAPGTAPKWTNLNNLLGISVATGSDGKTPNFRLPFRDEFKFTKVLPNVGAAYDIDDHQGLYATYSMGFSAPKTDDLYLSTNDLVKPETSENYGAGYRYYAQGITASVNLWYSNWKNHIVQSFDPNDPTLSIDRNVGSVNLYGADLEGGWTATEHFTLYASASFEHSALQNDYTVKSTSGATVSLPVKGKQLVLTPDQTYFIRGQYKWGPFTFGLEEKYTGKRYVSDVNDQSMPGYTVTDLDAEYDFMLGGRKAELQLNIDNLFNMNYLSRVGTVSNAKPVSVGNQTVSAASGPFYYIGAPITGYVALKYGF